MLTRVRFRSPLFYSLSAVVFAFVAATPIAANAQGVGCNQSGVACDGGNNSASGGWGVAGQSIAGYGVFGNDTSGGIGVYGATTNGKGVQGLASAGYGVFGNGGTGGWGVYGTSSGNYTLGVYGHGNGTLAAGLFGDCTGTSCYGLFVSGTSYFAGNINGSGTFNYSSDERLKKDIAPLRGSMDKLLQLHGVSFYWKDPSKHGNATGIQRGFIAQDYEKVFPEWVTTDNDGYKMITTTGLDSLEVESIRALKSENEDLKKHTTDLEKRIEALEAGRRPLMSSNGAWGWMMGMALACAAVVVSRRKSKGEK